MLFISLRDNVPNSKIETIPAKDSDKPFINSHFCDPENK